MLVLSRRVNEDVTFPNLGIRIAVLRTQGSRVRLGIEAPDSVQISRAPLEETIVRESSTVPMSHRVRNELNAMRLAIELFDRQTRAGDVDAANCTFLRMISRLRSADADLGGGFSDEVTEAATADLQLLVVEDDANERELLAGLLMMEGCRIATAEDGQAALEFLRKSTRPNLLLLDMHMPRLGGQQTLAVIRGDKQLRNLAVFGVSGNTPEACGVSVGTPDGVDDWFQKPLNPRQLVKKIRNRLASDAIASV